MATAFRSRLVLTGLLLLASAAWGYSSRPESPSAVKLVPLAIGTAFFILTWAWRGDLQDVSASPVKSTALRVVLWLLLVFTTGLGAALGWKSGQNMNDYVTPMFALFFGLTGACCWTLLGPRRA